MTVKAGNWNLERFLSGKWGIYLLFSGVIFLWLITPYVLAYFVEDISARGQTGDLFGTINALFSGLAFAGVIVAILLQRQELQLQKEEMKRSAAVQTESLYAQTLKAAFDILDAPESREAARYLKSFEDDLRKKKVHVWPLDAKVNADVIVRRYESVGAFVRRGLIPPDYLITNRAANVLHWWSFLSDYVAFTRGDRNEPFFGADFEYLADLVAKESQAATMAHGHQLGANAAR